MLCPRLKNLAPFSWCDDTQTLRFAAMADEDPVDIECRQNNHSVQMFLSSHGVFSAKQENDVHYMIRRALGLDINTLDLHKFERKLPGSKTTLIYSPALPEMGTGSVVGHRLDRMLRGSLKIPFCRHQAD